MQLDGVARVLTFLIGLPRDTFAGTACIVGTGLLMVFYAGAGGMRTTSLIQIVKAVALLVLTAAMAMWVLYRFHGDAGELLHAAMSGSGLGTHYLLPGNLDGDTTTSMWSAISLHVTVLFSTAGLPHVIMRLYAAPTPKSARSAARWATAASFAICVMAAFIGLGASALVGRRQLLATDSTGAASILLLARELDTSGLLLALLACVIFITALATVAGLTLAAASSAAHDLFAHALHRGRTTDTDELSAARWAATGIGTSAIALACAAQSWNLEVLSVVALTIAASAITPVLVYALFWPRFTRTGALWVLYGSTALVLLLITFSPQISGSPTAVFPHLHLDRFPLTAPGVITIPTGFALGWLGSIVGGAARPGAGRVAAGIPTRG
ncbi:hypothetical protein [Streptomyces sp. NPDC058964]|uniref:sodium:solute symporter family transporter n=1 Tax=Streptomyces sp. NPDC058964 TaxID=3346681 RepID=UPI003687B2BC